MKFRISNALKYLQNYISTYSDQKYYEEFTENIWIDDVLYGLGMSIDPEKYKFANGYDEFKRFLLSKLNSDLEGQRKCRQLIRK